MLFTEDDLLKFDRASVILKQLIAGLEGFKSCGVYTRTKILRMETISSLKRADFDFKRLKKAATVYTKSEFERKALEARRARDKEKRLAVKKEKGRRYAWDVFS